MVLGFGVLHNILLKMKLFTLENEDAAWEFYGLAVVSKGFTFAQFRQFLEDGELVEWSFEF